LIEVCFKLLTNGSIIAAICYLAKLLYLSFVTWQLTHDDELSDNKVASIAKMSKGLKLPKIFNR